MSVAMPAAGAAPQSGGVTLFGRRISYDALLLAGATLLGVFFAYNLSKSGAGMNLGVPAAAAPNPTLPDPGGVSATVTSDPTSSTLVGGGVVPTTTLGAASTVAARSTGSSTPQPTPPAAPAPVFAKVLGLIGSGGGPNTTGRSSGTQIYDGAATAPPAAHVVNTPHTVLAPVPHPAAPIPPIPAFREPTAGGVRGGPQML